MSAAEAELEPEPDAEEGADQLGEQAANADSESAPEAATTATWSPFYDVAAQVNGQVRARAGYVADGEIVRLAVDVTVGLTRAEQAHGLALGWYADAVWRATQGEANDDA